MLHKYFHRHLYIIFNYSTSVTNLGSQHRRDEEEAKGGVKTMLNSQGSSGSDNGNLWRPRSLVQVKMVSRQSLNGKGPHYEGYTDLSCYWHNQISEENLWFSNLVVETTDLLSHNYKIIWSHNILFKTFRIELETQNWEKRLIQSGNRWPDRKKEKKWSESYGD